MLTTLSSMALLAARVVDISMVLAVAWPAKDFQISSYVLVEDIAIVDVVDFKTLR